MSFNSSIERKGAVGAHTIKAIDDARALGYNAVVTPVSHDSDGNATFKATHKDGVMSTHTYCPSKFS